jgi:hypothetical protein
VYVVVLVLVKNRVKFLSPSLREELYKIIN